MENLYFIKFDVIDYYPSITENLLIDAIAFARDHTHVSEDEVKILLNARKQLIVDSTDIWQKSRGFLTWHKVPLTAPKFVNSLEL